VISKSASACCLPWCWWAFVLALALAVFLGWVLARRVMAPGVRLARQVRHRDQLLGLAPPLAPGLRGR
jgi:lauroyl/myristoyl acyltransferase